MLGSGKCLGVDIGGRDIKIVEMRKTGKTYEIVQAARIKLHENDTATALGHFLLETATYPANVVCSLPTHICSVKFAEVPRAKPKELSRMARFEAESQIPLPLSEVIWGFTAGGLVKAAMRQVVLAAARTSDVEDALAVMDSAHAQPSVITVSALAAAKLVSSANCADIEPILIVDIGAQWTDFCAVEAGQVYGCRSVKLGSEDLTQAFAHDFKVDVEEAEEIKRSRGVNLDVRLAGEEIITEDSQVERWLEKVAEEARRSTLGMTGSLSGQRPQRAIIVGGLAAISGLAVALSRRAGISMEVGDPWSGMSRSAACSHNLRESPAAFATATGLARTGLDSREFVNLMPRRLAQERTRRRKETTAVASLGVAALALLVIWLVGAPPLRAYNSELQRLDVQVKRAQRDVMLAGPDLKSQVAAMAKVVASVEDNDSNCLQLLRQLSENLPRSVWLTEMSFDGGKSVVLKGGSLSNSAIADAVDSLTQLDYFGEITLDYSNLAKGGSQSYDFQITCAVHSSKTAVSKHGAGSKTGIMVQ